MKNAIILLKEKLSNLQEVLIRIENAESDADKLDRDMMLALLREAYSIASDMDHSEEPAETVEQQVERLVNSRMTEVAQQQQQTIATMVSELVDRHIQRTLNEMVDAMIETKMAALTAITMVAPQEDNPDSEEVADIEKAEGTETIVEPEAENDTAPETVIPQEPIDTPVETPISAETSSPEAIQFSNPIVVPDVVIPVADEEPIFAPEEPVMDPITPSDEHSVEESNANDDLFEESPSNPIPPAAETKPAETTLWDMLQSKQNAGSIADRFKPGQSLVDQYAQPKATPQPIVATQPTPESQPETKSEPEPIAKSQPQPEKTPATHTVADSTPQPDHTPAPQPAPAPQAEAKPEPKAATGSLFDLLRQDVTTSKPLGEHPVGNGNARTLADKLMGGITSNEPRIEERVNSHKVQDLRTVISISDKFQFMNDLFHNNMKAYNDFILLLNATSNRTDALKVVEETASSFKWDKESLTAKKFMSVFDRKF